MKLRGLGWGALALSALAAQAPGCGESFSAAPPGTATGVVGGQGGSAGAGVGAGGGEGGHGAQGGEGGDGGDGGQGGEPLCEPPMTLPCYDGPDGTQGVGSCHEGEASCVDGAWGPCEGQQLPADEDCALDEDEDCDGVVCSSHVWSTMFGGALIDRVHDVAVDVTGRVAVVGEVGSIVMINGEALAYSGGSDAFVALFDPDGTVMWARAFGGAGNDSANAVAFDSEGRLLVAGSFTGTVNLLGPTFVAGGETDGFVLRLIGQGSADWSRQLTNPTAASPPTGTKEPLALAVDGDDAVVVVGRRTGCWGTPQPCLPPDGDEVFVRRYRTDNSAVWARDYGGSGSQIARTVALDSQGRVIIGGAFDGQLAIAGTTFVVPAGSTHGFLAQLDPSGTGEWAQSFGSGGAPAAQAVNAVATAPNGEFVAVGYFVGAMSLGSIDLASVAGAKDVFVARFDQAGTPLWGAAYGDSSPQHASDVVVDAAGNIVVVGGFTGWLGFGGPQLQAAGLQDAFLAKLAATGEQLWHKRFGGNGVSSLDAVDVFSGGRIAVGGTATFGIDLGGGELSYVGLEDGMVGVFEP